MRTKTIARVVAGACLAAAAALGPIDVACAAPQDDSSGTPQPNTQMVIAVVVPPHEGVPATPAPSPSGVPGGHDGGPVDGRAPGDQLAPTGDQLTGALVFAAAAAALIGGGALLRRRAARD